MQGGPKQYTVQDTKTGKQVTFEWNDAKPPTDSDFEEIFGQAGLRSMPDSLKNPTVQSDVTNYGINPNFRPQTSAPLADVVVPAARLAAGVASGSLGANPKQTIADVGSVGEFALPFLSAPIANPLLRAILGGGLQGTATALKLAGQGKTIGPMLSGAAQSALMGTGLGMIGEGIGGSISNRSLPVGNLLKLTPDENPRMIAPFARQFKPQDAALAQKYGMQLPASSTTSSRVVPLIETVAGKSLFTNRIGDMVDASKNRLNQIVDDAVGSLGKSTVPTDVGQSVERGFNQAENTFRTTKDALYGAAQLNKGDVTVTPKRAIPQLDNVIEDLSNVQGKKPAVLGYLKSLRSALNPRASAQEALVAKLTSQGFDERTIHSLIQSNPQLLSNVDDGIDAQKVLATVRDMNTKTNFKNPHPIVQGYEGRIRGIAASLNSDLDDAISSQRPDLADAIGKANSYYSEGIQKLNSQWGQKINTFIQNGKASEIAPSLLNRQTPTEWIPQIYETLGDDAKKSLQAATLEKIAKDARSPQGFLTPQGIDRQVKNYGSQKLSALLGDDKVGLLKDVGRLSEMIGRAQKVSEGSQTALLGRIAGEAAGMFFHPLQTLRILMGDAGFSKFIASDAGQKFLTSGLEMPQNVGQKMGQAVRIGGQMIPPLFQQQQSPPATVPNR